MAAPSHNVVPTPDRPSADSPSEARSGLIVPIVAAIGAALFVGLFLDVLFADRQLLHRDGAHFYWPYFKRIAAEWGAGRVPLWNPFENGGMPLAANPTAGVFYPAKLLFLLPYAVAYKAYLLLHVVLAAFAAHRAARGFGASPSGAAFSALAYAGSGFVLYQLYNVVYLCGAAWLPLGLLAAYRLVTRGAWRDGLILAVVMAMEVLAGDPQAAYLTGVLTAGFALCVHGGRVVTGVGRRLIGLGAVLAIGHAVVAGRWPAWILASVAGALAIVALRRHAPDGIARRNAIQIASVGTLALGLVAVQVLPTAELIVHALRDLSTTSDVVANFSYFPLNLVDLFLPAVFGSHDPVYTRWAPWTLLEGDRWVPSIYMGLSTMFAAACALRFRAGSVGARLLTWTMLLSLWMALGPFGGPSWGAASSPGGLYAVAMQLLPGFDAFRYPSKLLVWTVLCLALLAGMGVERLLDPGRRRLTVGIASFTAVVAGSTVAWSVGLLPLPGLLPFDGPGSLITGPFDADAAAASLRRSLIHGSAFGALLLALRWGSGRRRAMPAAVLPTVLLVMLALDLGLAGRRWMFTDDTAEWQTTPDLVRTLEAAERAAGRDEPFRIFRPMNFYPLHWQDTGDEERRADFYRWERRTLRPKLGIEFGVQHALAAGTIDPVDTALFFEPWERSVPPELRDRLPDQPEAMFYYPRNSFNLWNVRYFLIPFRQHFASRSRSMLTLLGTPDGRIAEVLAQSPEDAEDFFLLRNEEALPRAWAVHRVDLRKPLTERTVEARIERIRDLVHRDRDMGIAFWPGSDRRPYPFRDRATIETDDRQSLASVEGQAAAPPGAASPVRIARYEPQQVTLDVEMAAPGVAILADSFYPGWQAEVDGERVPILRANRAMRGVALTAGSHRIVMRYRPWTFTLGATISAVAWLALALAAFRLRRS